MMTRMKNAAIVFTCLAIAVIAALSLDYTDTYVAGRFNKALAAQQYEVGSPFSLDAFLEYYDWDHVYVITPGIPRPELKTQFGMSYSHMADDGGSWRLLFVKSYYVVAEINIQRSDLEYPRDLAQESFERWAAIVEIMDDGDGYRMDFVGE